MQPKKLKLFNGGDWGHQGGHLYVSAYSVKDAADLVNQAYRKLSGSENSKVCSVSEIQTYWSKGCWGKSMVGITPERGVWWAPEVTNGYCGKPERIF